MVSNRDEQRLFEQSVISELQPNLNQVRAHTTVEQKIEQALVYRDEHKEQIKEYYNKNKERIKEYKKEYRNENKGKISEYYSENREAISEQKKIKIHCLYCDTHTRRSDIKRHNKTNKHKKNIYFHYLNFIHS